MNFSSTKTDKQLASHLKVLVKTVAAISIALALVISISLFSPKDKFRPKDLGFLVRGEDANTSSMDVDGNIVKEKKASMQSSTSGSSPFQPDQNVGNKLQDGLLAPGLDEASCLSRYMSSSYRRNSPNYKPSYYLLSKLREYEDRHRDCAPYSKGYKKAMKVLASADHQVDSVETRECNYIVWSGYKGLGNRMLSLASAFLYSLLTNRVLLTYQGPDMANLFCEPFPNTSWLLPPDFPLQNQLYDSHKVPFRSFGNLVQKIKNSSEDAPAPPSLFLYLSYDFEDHDQVFYLDRNQGFLRQVPWLILVSNYYFAPYFYRMSSFHEELDLLFPDKDSIFHHLGRYLFHPSNLVWGLITRSYHAYLADSDQRIGLQVRVIHPEESPSNLVLDHLLACSKKEKILPEVQENITSTIDSPPIKTTTKAILIASLYSDYFIKISEMYWTKPTLNGEIVRVYQPSHEGYQQFGENKHNVKAWAEIYLLSLCDVLVTTSQSTFGYVAQGLGGLKPWIFYLPRKNFTHGPVQYCRRAMSMEPCFLYPPYIYRKTGKMQDVGPLGSFLRHCEDAGWGLKLVGYN